MPFGFQNTNDFFSVLGLKINKQRDFMKVILSIYGHHVMMQVKFHQDVIRCREVIAL